MAIQYVARFDCMIVYLLRAASRTEGQWLVLSTLGSCAFLRKAIINLRPRPIAAGMWGTQAHSG